MNLRNFQTQLNEAAAKAQFENNDGDPEVVVISAPGVPISDFQVRGITVSELDGKIVISLVEAVRPLGYVH